MAKYNGPSFVTEFLLQPNFIDTLKLENTFAISRVFYNQMLRETLKRFNQMNQDKRYQKNKRCIKGISKKINRFQQKIENETDKKKIRMYKKDLKIKEQERKQLYDLQQDLMKEFGYQEYMLHAFATELNHYYTRLDSNTIQKLATRAFLAVEKIHKGKAKRVYFKKYGTMDSIEGKTNKSGIKFREEKGRYVMKLSDLIVPILVKQNDVYAHQAIYDVSKISYCKIVRRVIRGKMKYYIQLTIKGVPPIKPNRTLGVGKVGIDPSLQMMAIVSEYRALLAELAPNLQNMQNEIRLLQRKLQRSRQVTNPNKFNADGTFKKGNKDPWARSNNYQKILFQLKDLHRKQTAIRKLAHNRLSNLILRLGNEFYIEKNSFRSFQKRKKKTVKKKGKFQSKKRYGKAIASKAPSMFLTLLKNKASYLGGTVYEISPRNCKPSQYDHIANSYKKKKLSERFHVFDNGTKVQRDLYSAFLIQQADGSTHKINRKQCLHAFSSFQQLHDIEMNRIKNVTNKLSCFGV